MSIYPNVVLGVGTLHIVTYTGDYEPTYAGALASDVYDYTVPAETFLTGEGYYALCIREVDDGFCSSHAELVVY